VEEITLTVILVFNMGFQTMDFYFVLKYTLFYVLEKKCLVKYICVVCYI